MIATQHSKLILTTTEQPKKGKVQPCMLVASIGVRANAASMVSHSYNARNDFAGMVGCRKYQWLCDTIHQTRCDRSFSYSILPYTN